MHNNNSESQQQQVWAAVQLLSLPSRDNNIATICVNIHREHLWLQEVSEQWVPVHTVSEAGWDNGDNSNGSWPFPQQMWHLFKYFSVFG